MNKYFVLLSVLLYTLGCSIAVSGQSGYQYTSLDTVYTKVLDGVNMDPANSSVRDTSAFFSLYNLTGDGTIFAIMDTTNGKTGGIMPPVLRVDLQIADSLGNWASKTETDSIFSFIENNSVPGKWYYDTWVIPSARYGRIIVVCDTIPWITGTAADTSKYSIKIVLGIK